MDKITITAELSELILQLQVYIFLILKVLPSKKDELQGRKILSS
jgi:hypothetical protein